MTQKQAQAYCEKWRRRFRLAWRVRVFMMGADRMGEHLGLCWQDMEHRKADIWLLETMNTVTMKRTIIHELLHAVLDPMMNIARDSVFEDGLRQLDRILHRTDKRY